MVPVGVVFFLLEVIVEFVVEVVKVLFVVGRRRCRQIILIITKLLVIVITNASTGENHRDGRKSRLEQPLGGRYRLTLFKPETLPSGWSGDG